jgi:hypothetical protein
MTRAKEHWTRVSRPRDGHARSRPQLSPLPGPEVIAVAGMMEAGRAAKMVLVASGYLLSVRGKISKSALPLEAGERSRVYRRVSLAV